MSNISEYLYEIFAAILFCFGLTFAISLYNTSTTQSETVAQQNTAKENIAESTDGYEGNDLISGSTVVANIMADAGETKTIVDGVEIPKELIARCVESKNPSILMQSVDTSAVYQISYTENSDGNDVQAVIYTKNNE